MKRGGFTLIEVLVASTLLGVAVLTLAASSVLAAGLIRSAQREETAARWAGTLLDSLLLLPDPGAGQASTGSYAARWSPTVAGALTLSVSYSEGGRMRVHTWDARGLAMVQGLPALPGERP